MALSVIPLKEDLLHVLMLKLWPFIFKIGGLA